MGPNPLVVRGAENLWHTPFTDLVGCRIPIQLAGMAPIATPPLALAVSVAGGLGMIAGSGHPAPFLNEWVRSIKSLTSAPFGVNFLPHSYEPQEIRESIEAVSPEAKVVEFFYSDPDPVLVGIVHAHGSLAAWQVGSPQEAVAAESAGCDLLVAQGTEAGGHVRGHVGLLALLSDVLARVKVPVLAAGGIGTGRAMAAALAAGASGVRIGTRFVAAAESIAHPEYVKQLIAADSADTVLTEKFHINFENAPHRVLRSSVEAADAFQGEVVGESAWPSSPKDRYPVRRFQSSTPTQLTSGEIRAMPLWAGESVGAVKRVQPAAEIVAELAEEAEQLLRKWST